MPQSLVSLGGQDDAPVMHIAIANGFPPETYLPIANHFEDNYRIVSAPPRALWGDGQPPAVTPDASWKKTLTTDYLKAFEQYNLNNMIGIGHSFGGIATLLSALQSPDLFKAIILLDPVILPRAMCQWIQSEHQAGRIVEPPMVAMARKRQREFKSVDSAFDNFYGRSIFKDWSDEVLRLYVEHGTQPCGEHRCLSWSPEWEATYFATYFAGIWDELPKLDNLNLPILFIAGGDSDTYLATTAQEVSEMLPSATHKTIAGYGHMFPQANPTGTAQMIGDWLAEQGI